MRDFVKAQRRRKRAVAGDSFFWEKVLEAWKEGYWTLMKTMPRKSEREEERAYEKEH